MESGDGIFFYGWAFVAVLHYHGWLNDSFGSGTVTFAILMATGIFTQSGPKTLTDELAGC